MKADFETVCFGGKKKKIKKQDEMAERAGLYLRSVEERAFVSFLFVDFGKKKSQTLAFLDIFTHILVFFCFFGILSG